MPEVTEEELLSVRQLTSAPTSLNNDVCPSIMDSIQPLVGDNQTANDAEQSSEQAGGQQLVRSQYVWSSARVITALPLTCKY